LDCLLISFLILIVAVNFYSARAEYGYPGSTGELLDTDTNNFLIVAPTSWDLANNGKSPNQPLLDSNTLAAMIAAENAALTSPQYLLELPMVVR
jgi:hypothetical protein